MRNLPFYLTPVLIWFWTVFFFFFAAPARRALVANLAVVLPGSGLLANYVRAWRVMCNYAWTIAEGSHFKQHKSHFAYELEGAEFLDRLGAARGAIVLTAHMGSYDFGAALFAERFQREIRMVRMPSPINRPRNISISLSLKPALERSASITIRPAINSLSIC